MLRAGLNVLLVGPPGGGKGTVCSRLVRDLGMVHIALGNLLRSEVQQGSELGRQISAQMTRGELVDDKVALSVLVAQLRTLQGNILLDGFPRTRTQAELLKTNNVDLSLVLHLNVPDQTIIDRISKRWIHPASGRIYNTEFNPPKVSGIDDVSGEPLTQREDDKAEVVSARLVRYHAEAEPLLGYYERQGLVNTFTGTETNVMYPHILALMKARLSQATNV
eukprot:c42186_g1_i1.p1 GENE.c42186_g1_i1~~c42186_g1_i1.p1  ORF type:complete len:221 (+),score=54.53 c42186_g1_i1:40-702(+)